MAEVCHKCPLWKGVTGKDPNTGEDYTSHYDCSLSWLVTGMFEMAQKMNQMGAATESFRNEMKENAHALLIAAKNNKKAREEPIPVEYQEVDGAT